MKKLPDKFRKRILPDKAHIFSATNRVFTFFSLVAGTAVVYFLAAIAARFLSEGQPSIYGIPVYQEYAIVVLAVLTFIHILILRYAIHYFEMAWRYLDGYERQQLYLQLTAGNHFITHGAERFRDAIHNKNGFLFVHVRKEDPPSVLHWAMFASAVFASIRYELSFDFVWTLVLGLVLSMFNWQIGSSWLVALSDLGRESDSSLYFDSPERTGPRYFGIVSGPWSGMNNNIFVFAAISFVDSFFRIAPAAIGIFLVWTLLESYFWIWH